MSVRKPPSESAPYQRRPAIRCLRMKPAKKATSITLPDLNLAEAERRLCLEALTRTGSLVEAAELLGTNRHALRRLIAKHGITWWPYAQQQNGWRGPKAPRQRAQA